MNIGNSSPTNLMDFIIELEKKLEIKAKINYMDIQPGDVPMTFADNNKLFETINYKPKISIKEGISNFVDWYKKYYLKL
jgi:UDP-glucuronate 4-epimerase